MSRCAALVLAALLFSSCGAPVTPIVATYISTVGGGSTADFSPSATARLLARVRAGPPLQKCALDDPHPKAPGHVRLEGRDYEFHGVLILRVDRNHEQVFTDPMLDFMWERGPLSDAGRLVARADEWLEKNPGR